MQGLTFSLNKNWKKKIPKVFSDQTVFLTEEVFYLRAAGPSDGPPAGFRDPLAPQGTLI